MLKQRYLTKFSSVNKDPNQDISERKMERVEEKRIPSEEKQTISPISIKVSEDQTSRKE